VGARKDATGADAGFRAHYGDEGPKIEHLQHELNEHYPAYSPPGRGRRLRAQTAEVLDEFSERAAHEAQTPAADRQRSAPPTGATSARAPPARSTRHGLI
jgi:hypothetical protein